jgi:hypothetical protein
VYLELPILQRSRPRLLDLERHELQVAVLEGLFRPGVRVKVRVRVGGRFLFVRRVQLGHFWVLGPVLGFGGLPLPGCYFVLVLVLVVVLVLSMLFPSLALALSLLPAVSVSHCLSHWLRLWERLLIPHPSTPFVPLSPVKVTHISHVTHISQVRVAIIHRPIVEGRQHHADLSRMGGRH